MISTTININKVIIKKMWKLFVCDYIVASKLLLLVYLYLYNISIIYLYLYLYIRMLHL